MRTGRRRDVPVGDLSVIRGLWEGRVKRHRVRQRKEKERVEQSALAKIDQQWQFRIYCKTLKSKEREQLQQYLERNTLSDTQTHTAPEQQDEKDPESNDLVFSLEGDQWKDFPSELQWKSYLREWRVSRTKICRLPEYLALFTQLTVLHMPKNRLSELPKEIGKLTCLKELNLSFNRLSLVPSELGECEALQRLELAANQGLNQLPFELSSLKQLVHLDIAQNLFVSIPICALRMSRLRLLDLSHNQLTDLPQDMDRLDQLETLLVHKNRLTYLPQCLCDVSTLTMIVVSGDQLNCIPTALCSNPKIKFIRLYDNPASEERRKKEEEKKEKKKRWTEPIEEEKDSREKEFMEAYINTLHDRDTVPFATTKVSISCLL